MYYTKPGAYIDINPGQTRGSALSDEEMARRNRDQVLRNVRLFGGGLVHSLFDNSLLPIAEDAYALVSDNNVGDHPLTEGAKRWVDNRAADAARAIGREDLIEGARNPDEQWYDDAGNVTGTGLSVFSTPEVMAAKLLKKGTQKLLTKDASKVITGLVKRADGSGNDLRISQTAKQITDSTAARIAANAAKVGYNQARQLEERRKQR